MVTINYDNIFSAIKKLGTELSPDYFKGVQNIYKDIVPKPINCKIQRDVKYGRDERNILDIFTPKNANNSPVLIYVHGGGFISGNKGNEGEPFYNNVGAWATNNNLVGITINYRLAPANVWPSGIEDLTSAIEWIKNNIYKFGGDPNRIFIIGQSAGAAHVASYVASLNNTPIISGAILVSGLYDVETIARGKYEDMYFGTDEANMKSRSSIYGLSESNIPFIIAVSEFDALYFQKQALNLMNKCFDTKSILPKMIYLNGHNHMSQIFHLGLENDVLGTNILEFIHNN